MTDAQKTVIAALISVTEQGDRSSSPVLYEHQTSVVNEVLYWFFIAGDGLSIDEADHLVDKLEDANLRTEPALLKDMLEAFSEADVEELKRSATEREFREAREMGGGMLMTFERHETAQEALKSMAAHRAEGKIRHCVIEVLERNAGGC